MNAIEIKNLTKSFPGFTLNNLNLTLPGGCILGLIGENGAGKSTTIKLILDIIHKDSGSITILGRDNTENIRLTKEEVGVVMDEIGLPECLTVPQAGKVMAHTFRSWDASAYQALVRRMDLPEKKPFKDFSRGMKMKLGIAIALSHHCKLLLLDEHTAALDPKTAAKVLELSDNIVNENHLTTLMVTHNMKHAIQYGNRLIMMQAGRVVVDIQGEEKKNLKVSQLLEKFEQASGEEFANDRMMLA